MKPLIQLISSALLLIFSVSIKAQQNSPWKTYTDQIVNGVLAVPGSHEYSLSGGQGFAVYLKNQNKEGVIVTGLLTAKTTCGKNVTTRFNVNLLAGQSSSGSNFDKTSSTGQTGVVTEADCGGVRLGKSYDYINRINNVVVSDLKVSPLSNASNNNTDVPTPTITKIFKEPVVQTLTPEFDSTAYYRNNWYSTRDSLMLQIIQLKNMNAILLDSLSRRNSPEKMLNPVAISKPVISKVATTVKPWSLSILGGLGWDKLPLIANYDTSVAMYRASYTYSTSHQVLQLGLLAKLFNDKQINLELSPFVSYGINFLNNQTGSHLTYGLNACVLAGLNNTLPVKLALTGNYTGRNGSWNESVNSADYNYNLIKYGAGLRFLGKYNKFWIQPGVYWDNPNAKITGTAPSLVAAIDAEIANKWRLNFSYSSDYLNQGTQKYATFFNGQQNYFSIRILGTFSRLK
ncbi:hypothetical protein ACFOW1_08060 [Parasediminibacterium paludis]|uniref:Uncharacterized protein n=1 Tax=Parasediminibacterium paludis TaxID=908966 RepID=A0ABV8PXT3_9BACT